MVRNRRCGSSKSKFGMARQVRQNSVEIQFTALVTHARHAAQSSRSKGTTATASATKATEIACVTRIEMRH